MKKSGRATPIVDRNGKATTVYRTDKTADVPTLRIPAFRPKQSEKRLSHSDELLLTSALREEFPRSHFFVELTPSTEDPELNTLTVYHDLNPYSQRAAGDVDDIQESLVRSLTRYFYIEETNLRDSSFPVLEILDISEKPTSLSYLEDKVLELSSSDDPENLALAIAAVDSFRAQEVEDGEDYAVPVAAAVRDFLDKRGSAGS